MNKEEIEELAFKDRKELANLNELDLLEIIEFLQLDRKQWINQYSTAHNDYVDLQQENKQLKEDINKYKRLGFKHLNDKCNKLENQQKEFIEYLEDYLKLFDNKDIYEEGSYDTIEEILSKYKEIIGDDK